MAKYASVVRVPGVLAIRAFISDYGNCRHPVRLVEKKDTVRRLMAVIYLCVMAAGILQYPLSVIGNGFADNNKEMYCFMLCHDILIVWSLAVLPRLVREWAADRQAQRAERTASNSIRSIKEGDLNAQ